MGGTSGSQSDSAKSPRGRQSSAPDRRARSKYGEWEMLLARLRMNKRAPREWKVGTRSRMCNAAVAGAEYFGGVSGRPDQWIRSAR